MKTNDIVFNIVCREQKINVGREGAFMLLCNYMDPSTALSFMYVLAKNPTEYVFNWSVSKNTIYLYRIIDCNKRSVKNNNVMQARILHYKTNNINDFAFVCNEDWAEVYCALDMLRIQRKQVDNIEEKTFIFDGAKYGLELVAYTALGKSENGYSTYYTTMAGSPFDVCKIHHNDMIDWGNGGLMNKTLTGLKHDYYITYEECSRIALYGDIVVCVEGAHDKYVSERL